MVSLLNVMKLSFSRYCGLYAVLAAVLSLSACSSQETARGQQVAGLAPEEVALCFLGAIETGDVKWLESHMFFSNAQEERRYADYFARVGEYVKRDGATAGFELNSVDLLGDTAFVKVDGKDAFGKKSTVELRLVKSAGQWKVCGSFPLTELKKK
jgi:hypothetical protein